MSDHEQSAARFVTGLLLAAVACLGLAQIAFLPPWEGFDETAHWSYIQELSDAGHAPRYGADSLSADLNAYSGPMAYGAAAPFDQTGRPTYRSYRLAGAPPIQGGPTRYVGAGGLNWQAQHPPLYYALMAPLYRAAHGLGWINHLLILRLASFALAFAGLTIGVLATVQYARPIGPWTGPIMAAWPFLFPQFFPEFARLGNDSPCLLLAAVAWAALLRLLDGRGRWVSALVLGVSLGLGLLTKAFFLPVSAGVLVMLALQWRGAGGKPAVLGQAALACGLALAIGGWWYISREMQTGSLVGSDEFIRFNQSGGLGRLAGGFSLGALAAPLLAGLVYHILVWAMGVGAATPGWYLHILAAPLGLAVARGWTRPRTLGLLTLLTGVYSAATWAFQLSMFSGCAAKLGANKHYDLAGAGCFIDRHALAAVGHPLLGMVCLVLGAVLALSAALWAWRAFRPSEMDFLPERQS